MKKYILLCPFLLILIFSGCGIQPAVPSASASPSPVPTPAAIASPPEATAADYFPTRENVRYVYAGAGSEYASFDVYADYASDTRVQQRINNGGTVVARVVEVTNDRVTRVYNREESYHRENALDKTNDSEILLMTPIETGTSWTLDDGRVRTITGVSVSVETPSGSYSSVAVETSGNGSKTTDYYAKGTGLVKTISEGEGYEVSSALSEMEENTPFKQTVRFYYPDSGDREIYYKDLDLSFRTNDVTRTTLENAYKEPPAGAGRVFSDNTRINSYYLNEDGMVYLDLSKDFVTEMSADSGAEALILQCVANTFGSYCGADKVIVTVDNGPYESGRVKMEKGEYLTVETDGIIAIP